ncbi:BamA/TamA family outer membrane protein [Oceanihabitans sediminis]|uniref:Outer membrane protein assembly factor n=1 Tax=Oceanihabitans sediminis TaxID=1812012 RepID=A0A368P9X5_9FLAO|nr:BamA/TamA family outer membrane protein [Oceanihabitans sediminis]MDX1277656.1 BamA/TamA family outer membrane protein [Oceanihabitans sediminis]MDX1773888.1 BamA/TamA family outer membrane protein [Oceanihabitans sediminis]RBP32084.1 surface antigen-like protein [Oceanihabitans sediminis]RCU58735.1 outer membrane protein assembly factor [Oceanihabitans sediminis]
MKLHPFKIVFLVFIAVFISSCNTIKRVGKTEHLLVNNTITVNDKKNNTERINNLISQKPNRKILKVLPLKLHIYNLARPNIDSIVNEQINRNPKRKARMERFLSKKQLDKYIEAKVRFNAWLKKTGEAPVIINDAKTEKSLRHLEAFYINNGWFNAEATAKIDTLENQRATINYTVKTGKPYFVDTLTTSIASPVLDSLYKLSEKNSFIKKEQYKTTTFEQEKDRLTDYFRNSGVYHFSQDYVFFEMDSIANDHKVKVDLQINNRVVRKLDSNYQIPFTTYKVKDVNIFTTSSYENRNKTISDTLSYKNYNLFSIGKMRFNPKALTDAIFITPNNTFRDINRTRTYRHISNLKTFKYPDIEYIENNDSTLTANIYLTPLKKFNLSFRAEVSQSNIQTVGFSLNPSLLMRNVFRGAETLELSAIGSIGSSKDAANDRDHFFDINEIGANLRLTIPRLLSPFNTERIIPKHMLPSTRITLSTTSQTNIGLDKQTLSGVFNYKWLPNKTATHRYDVFNLQYVRNLNIANYFQVYETSFNNLNNIAQGLNYTADGSDLSIPTQTNLFINDVLNGNTTLTPDDPDFKSVSAINERKNRLTENNLIIASNYSYTKDKRENLFDETFSIFRFKLELAGNIFSAAANTLGLEKNNNDQYELFNVAFSQYVKTEFDYIRHWDLGKKNVLAARGFIGIAIPYGNSKNIPFSKSFFAGGTNDNRAWTAYNLGPGSSKTNNEFNEANLKIAFNFESRFNIFGDVNGALFVDVGNIWNVLDDVEDPKATFNNLSSLKDIAIGTGFGIRYDFGFAVARLDLGFKTYNPALEGNRWLKNYSLSKAVYNIGINYPF